jgi:hypothetical protein
MPQKASAHLAGQPPFFKINGEYSNLYPVPLTSLEDFDLPQDLATKNFLVGDKLIFELDTNMLPAPKEVIANTKFSWEFGDGNKGSGLAQQHTYEKMGSYILTIYADDGSTPTPQLLQSVMINILPDASYQLPKAVIRANNKQSTDPLVDILKFSLKSQVQFDSSFSQATSGKIVNVRWDFGDKESSDRITVSHLYDTEMSQVFPVLRVVDSNGFIGDTFIEIQNSDQDQVITTPTPKNNNSSGVNTGLAYPLAAIVVLIIGSFAVLMRRHTHHR